MNKGLTLVEVLVGVALFLLVAVSVYGGFTSIYGVVGASHVKITAASLINEQFEIIRNLEYVDVGIINSVPSGVLPHEQTLVRDGISFLVTTTIRNIDDPFDGLIGQSPNDLSPADYRLVEIGVTCDACKNFSGMSITSRVAPKNLETASTNGALFIQVLDSNGQPVSDADVHIVNTQPNPDLVIDDVTNTSGMLQVVDVPPGVQTYQITVSKSGYTSDQTYTPGDVDNPNPIKPHATVAVQQVTQVTLVIDRVSTINFSSITPSCAVVPNIDFTLTGATSIGTNPDVSKYSVDHVTNSSGRKTVSNMRWDTYTVDLTDSAYDLVGMNPPNPFTLVPNSSQDVDLIVVPKNTKSLLVSVRDASTQLPISGAEVTITSGSFTQTLITGQGFSTQSDWSGGSGQSDMVNDDQYFSSDGNIETNAPAGELKLKDIFGTYITDGFLVSSTFDTGTTSNFNKILWEPVGQPADTGADNVRFKVATNNDNATWNFIGPDGTAGSYYTISTPDLSSAHNNNEYLRYKIFLNTASTTLTPNIAQISFTYTSSCIPPGQAFFSDLSAGTYDVTVSRSGYEDVTDSVPVSANWQQHDIILLPE